MSSISSDSLYDLDLYLREMHGNSVNYNETDRLIKSFRLLIEEIKEKDSDTNLEIFVTKGEELKEHLIELPIHATANYWAKEKHLKYSKKFEEKFNHIKRSISI